MVAFSLVSRRIQRPLTNDPIRGLADISYSVYLIHFAVIWFGVSQLSLPLSGQCGRQWSGQRWCFRLLVYAYLSPTCWSARFGGGHRDFAGRVGPLRARRAGTCSPCPRAPAGCLVVIPTYNRSEWLRDAMDSVLAQDYPNLELVVVDDGSTDETPALLAEYARRHPTDRFQFLRQDNAGQARALNNGNALARGEILGYLSDDDLIAPGAVWRLTGELVAAPDAAVAYPGYHTIDEAGAVEDTVRPTEYSPLPHSACTTRSSARGDSPGARRWRRRGVGIALRWLGDFILWIGVGLAGRVIRLDDPLASWRRHSASVHAEEGRARARAPGDSGQRAAATTGLSSVVAGRLSEAARNACCSPR